MQIVQFPGPAGEAIEAGLDVPADGEPVGFALFVHQLSASPNTSAVDHITRALAADGIATLRVAWIDDEADERPNGNVQPGVASVAGVVRAAAYLEQEFEAPALLIGHSMGGLAVIAAEAAIASTRGVIAIAAPSSTDYAGGTVRTPVPELNAERVGQALTGIRGGMLFLHGPLDPVVSIDNAARLFQGARHPKSFVSLDAADHLLSSPSDSRFAGSVIAAWAGKYLETSEQKYASRSPADNQIVAITGGEGFRTEVMANGHPLVADEPASVGGTNTGPTPYNLLAAALASCTSMTLRMYADRKQWPLEEVQVTVKHSKIHAADCTECEDREGRIDHLHRIVRMEGPLDDAQRKRLLEIADRCPVHRTLEGEIRIDTEAGDAP